MPAGAGGSAGSDDVVVDEGAVSVGLAGLEVDGRPGEFGSVVSGTGPEVVGSTGAVVTGAVSAGAFRVSAGRTRR